jgi:ribose 5-phosphate isomerase B
MLFILGSDHAAFAAKEALKAFIQQKYQDQVEDVGTFSEDSCHYPTFAQKVCQRLKEQPQARGILLCGTGIGMSMVANRYAHIRAALCQHPQEAQLAREHNNANVLCLGARILTAAQMQAIFAAFREGPFAGGRHQTRLDLFASLGEKI